MAKTIIKEIGIALLLLIAIALILGILFYDYFPSNKTVPIKIQAYSMPEDIEEDLKKAIPNEQKIVKTYSIDNSVLDTYEATNDYDKGKANPFAEYKEEVTDTSTDSQGNNNITGNNTDSNTNNNTNNNMQNTNQDNTDQDEVYITTPGKNY